MTRATIKEAMTYKPTGKPVGKPSHVPTAEQRRTAESLSGIGVPTKEIASILDISAPTLFKHYRQELDRGQAKAIAKVSQNLYRMATSEGRDALTAAIFYLKCRAGWKPPPDVEITNTVAVQNNAKTPKLSIEQEEALQAWISRNQEQAKMNP